MIPNTSKYTIDTNKDGVEYATTINVFASVAGGTGSGMLIDTLCLINKAMKDLALQYSLYPWIVLPEIFKSMSNSPAMANVRYNAYGAIRSLDYIEHLDPNDPAINFGYTTITEPLFRNSSASAYIVDVFPPPPISAVMPGLISKNSHIFCIDSFCESRKNISSTVRFVSFCK